MEIKLPNWAQGIEDEGINTFIAFCYRVGEIHGFDTHYYISKDDISKMCNRVPQGIVEWLRAVPQIEDNMQVGEILDTTIVFQLDKPKGYRRKKNIKVGNGIYVELKDIRAQLVWMYLLGCLNSNFTGEADHNISWNSNAFGIREFNFTREAQTYIPVKERQARRDKYEDIKSND
jgi:hypothetical protein